MNSYKNDSDRILYKAAWVLIIFAAIVSVLLLIRACFAGLNFWEPLDMATTGQIGDFIGGFIGTVISGAGFIFLYLTLKSQNQAVEYQKQTYENEKIESRFFELLQLHRANVAELSFRSWKSGAEISNGRKVFKEIYNQLNYVLQLVTLAIRGLDQDTFVLEGSFISKFTSNEDVKKELIISNLAFSLVFFGVASESYEGLNNVLSKDFTPEFSKKFIELASLIPDKESKYWKDWSKFSKSNIFEDNIKGHFSIPPPADVYQVYNLREIKENLNGKKFFKFFGGHQSKLGHYYRHLFRTVDYIDSKPIPYHEKEEYIRILRAQLSNYEQFLLFFNSVCFMGREWELTYSDNQYKWLISKFNLIRNIPYINIKYKVGDSELTISLKNFYPLVAYEFELKDPATLKFITEIVVIDNIKVKQFDIAASK